MRNIIYDGQKCYQGKLLSWINACYEKASEPFKMKIHNNCE